MPKTTLAGHPLHPMLIVAPAALLPFGFVLDAMHRSTGKPSYAQAAYYSLVGGLVGGVAAGAAGAMDYMTIEPRSHVKRTGNIHALLNIGALALTAANVIARRNDPEHRGGSLALSAVAALGVAVSGWFGAHMVYEHGMRVKGVSPVEHEPDVELPGDEMLAERLHEVQKQVPVGGPVWH